MATTSKTPWTPRRVVMFVARFAGRCFWCGHGIAAGEPCAFYTDEKAVAHRACHDEAVVSP
jgi:hypothetical protein